MATSSPIDDPSVDFLHELGSRMASADALHEVLARVVDFASALMKCDSCLIYVLESENSNLSQQLETRKIVERAKGILQRDLSLDEEQAYLALQRQSRQKRKSMREVAEAVVLTDELRRGSQSN